MAALSDRGTWSQPAEQGLSRQRESAGFSGKGAVPRLEAAGWHHLDFRADVGREARWWLQRPHPRGLRYSTNHGQGVRSLQPLRALGWMAGARTDAEDPQTVGRSPCQDVLLAPCICSRARTVLSWEHARRYCEQMFSSQCRGRAHRCTGAIVAKETSETWRNSCSLFRRKRRAASFRDAPWRRRT